MGVERPSNGFKVVLMAERRNRLQQCRETNSFGGSAECIVNWPLKSLRRATKQVSQLWMGIGFV